MGGPARMAGFSAMHEFLMRGFDAFSEIGGASEFLARIDGRERTILERLYSGYTADWTQVPPPDRIPGSLPMNPCCTA